MEHTVCRVASLSAIISLGVKLLVGTGVHVGLVVVVHLSKSNTMTCASCSSYPARTPAGMMSSS